MREDLKETGDNPKKYKMALYYKDYKHIKILKHPNWWRYYYASAIDTS